MVPKRSFSNAIPLKDEPCGPPKKADFGKILVITGTVGLSVDIPFKSTRTSATKPEALGYDKESTKYIKSIPVIPEGKDGKYSIWDEIDTYAASYVYHVHNVCENDVRSKLDCKIIVPSNGDEPKVCEDSIKIQ